MSQGKHISDEVKGIVAAAVTQRPEASREELTRVIRSRIRAGHHTEPAKETILKLISHYRTHPESDLDKPWSLALLRQNELPADSLPTVMQVWRFALNIDWPMTIRQAFWASRLYRVFPNPTYLWMWSFVSSVAERSAELTGQALDASLLNVFAAQCCGWEMRTFELTEAPINQAGSHIRPALEVVPDGKALFESLAIGMESHGDSEDDDLWFHHDFGVLLGKLPDIGSIGLTFDAQMVYLRWFRYLTKGPKWKSLSATEAFDLVVLLRHWVAQQQKRLIAAQEAEPASSKTVQENLELDPHEIASEYPENLLRAVGYNPDPDRLFMSYLTLPPFKYPYLEPEQPTETNTDDGGSP